MNPLFFQSIMHMNNFNIYQNPKEVESDNKFRVAYLVNSQNNGKLICRLILVRTTTERMTWIPNQILYVGISVLDRYTGHL